MNVNAPRIELEIVQGEEPWGSIIIELEQEKAPATVENFLRYVDDGFFDGTIFHRVLPTFMIQGGGYTGPNAVKRTGLREPIENEARNGLKNLRGTIAMARTNEPNSATSQFFINVGDNDILDYPGQDGWGYCVFGKVVGGLDIVDRIKNLPTKPNPEMGGEDSQPLDPPAIRTARRIEA